MRGQTITYDGHRLNDLFYVGEVSVGLPDFQPTCEERAVGNGSVVRSMRMGTVDISVSLVARPIRGRDVRESLSDLVSWLDVDGPKVLQLSEDNGPWRLAVPSGAPTIGDTEWNDRVTVEFLQVEPALFGREVSVTVPSGGSLEFVVGGDHPTKPTVAAGAATRDSTTGLWGVLLDGGDALRVAVPTAQASAISMDCGERTCSVNGATMAPTLTSDWLVLTPGTHVVENDLGGGACTLTWNERWHR